MSNYHEFQSSIERQDAMRFVRSSRDAATAAISPQDRGEAPPYFVFHRHVRNELMEAVYAWLRKVAQESRIVAEQELHDLVGSVAEREDVQAATATLFLALDDGTLRAVVTYNVHKTFRDLHRDAAGIVPLVSRRREPYLTGDAHADPYYFEDVEETRSEVAVPLLMSDGRLLGVLNFESPREHAFGPGTIPAITSYLAEMVLHVLALQGLDDTSNGWCPWHPLVHGWDLQKLFTSLCRQTAECLGRDVTKCTVWYSDWAKDELFAYATFGYDYEYRNGRTLELGQANVGEAAGAPAGAVVDLNPRKFVKREKALMMGIEEGYGSPVYPASDPTTCRGVSAFTVYFNSGDDEECSAGRALITKEALPEICRMLGFLAGSFQRQRERMMAETIKGVLDGPEEIAGSHFDRIVDVVRTVFEAPGVSIWGNPTGCRRLECLGTTGLKDVRDKVVREQETGDDRCSYNLDEDLNSYTVFVTTMRGRALRKNKIGNTQEKGLPDGCPELPKAKFVEHLVGGDYHRRRLLCVAIMDQENVLGVIRVVRPEASKPFTICDERLIETLAECARPALEAWRCSRALAGSSNEQQILRVEVRSSVSMQA